MSQFLGTHQNRLDTKGRVSVPASFRAALRAADDTAIPLILRRSHKHPCIEGWPKPAFDLLATPLDELNVFSDDHDDMAVALYADAFPADTDKEGRIVLPQELVEHARLKDSVAFVAAGRYFQMWNPAEAERRRAQAREQARIRQLSLPARGHA